MYLGCRGKDADVNEVWKPLLEARPETAQPESRIPSRLIQQRATSPSQRRLCFVQSRRDISISIQSVSWAVPTVSQSSGLPPSGTAKVQPLLSQEPHQENLCSFHLFQTTHDRIAHMPTTLLSS